MMARLRRVPETCWHIGTLFILWALFFWRYFSPVASARAAFPDGDFTQQFYIFRDIAYRALAAGRLPLWSECFFVGYPFHADPQAQLFYPPIWLVFAVLRLLGWGHFPIAALTAEVAGHYLLTALFTYAFLRAEVGRASAALIGAVVFTFGGYLAGWPALQSGILETATWLPLILLTLRRLAARQLPITNHRTIALSALALTVAYFAGHPQTFLFVFYLSLAYFVYRLYAERRRLLPGLIAFSAVVALTGLLIAAQLLPTIEYLRLSSRASLDYPAASAGFAPQEIAQIVLTGLVGYWHPLYVGILPLALGLLALWHSIPSRLQGAPTSAAAATSATAAPTAVASASHHPVTLSPCHLVTPTLSPRHPVTSSPRHPITPSLPQPSGSSPPSSRSSYPSAPTSPATISPTGSCRAIAYFAGRSAPPSS